MSPLEVIASSALDAASFVVVAICVRIVGVILLVRIARGREFLSRYRRIDQLATMADRRLV